MARTPSLCRVAPLVGVLVIGAPLAAVAQTFVCRPIVRGDTARSLARKLTGNPGAVYSERFQIRDPARAVFVPKSQYHRLRTHWQACLFRDPLVSRATPVALTPLTPRVTAEVPHVVATEAAPLAAAPLVPESVPADLTRALRVGVAVSLVLFLCTMAVRLAPPRPPPPDLQHAAEQFVYAFAQPLTDPGSGAPPILARLQFVRRAEQIEIHLAPNGGRRYPNLTDHKTNLEYDVDRVMRLIGQRFVVRAPIRAEGKWVVVPIRRADSTRER